MKPNMKSVTTQYEVTLSQEDEAILHALDPFLEGVAKAFGNNCEVVLHSLEDLGHSVIKIVNGHVTGRKVGSPMTDYGLEVLSEAQLSGKDVVGHYYTKSEDGRLLKSVTVVIRNGRGSPIGMACINIDLSVPLLEILKQFSPHNLESYDKEVEHFPSNLDGLVSRMLEVVIERVDIQKELSKTEKNKAIVMEMYQRGLFKVAGVVDIVAKKMGISRYTVYNYIREAKIEIGE